tara:strand:- start:6304 stop:6774 length:471 start_codon:yes stop_codon:yes gene_type:complete
MFEPLLMKSLRYSNVFDAFVAQISGLHCTSQKAKIWESFTSRFLSKKYRHIYRVDQIPKNLSLPSKDVGIDFVVSHDNESFSAVQTKFRKNDSISWRHFSTFDSLCSRSGPWDKCILVTNAKSVKIYGNAKETDQFYGYKYFKNWHRDEWKYFICC